MKLFGKMNIFGVVFSKKKKKKINGINFRKTYNFLPSTLFKRDQELNRSIEKKKKGNAECIAKPKMSFS